MVHLDFIVIRYRCLWIDTEYAIDSVTQFKVVKELAQRNFTQLMEGETRHVWEIYLPQGDEDQELQSQNKDPHWEEYLLKCGHDKNIPYLQ